MNRTNMSSIKEAMKRFPDIPLGLFSGISLAIFAVIGIFANGLVLLVLIKSQQKRSSAYIYLISHLAFADFVCSIFFIVYVPVELNQHNWVYAKYACKLIYPSITFFENLAVGTVIILSFERYKGVILPHWSPWKKHNIWIALAVVWFIGLIIIIPNIMIIKVTKYENINYCNENWRNETYQSIYGISFFLIAFFAPSLAVAIMHVHIMCRLRGRDVRPSNESDSRDRNDTRIIRVLTAIIVAFFVCTSPNKILYLVWDVTPSLEKSLTSRVRLYFRTLQILYYSRVAVDPLLYCFFDTRFKKDLKNTKKSIRGFSFNESELTSRSCTRTLSSPAAAMEVSPMSTSSAILNEHNIMFNGVSGLGMPRQTVLSVIRETTLDIPVESDMQVISNERCNRSESFVTERTIVYGSSSPFGLSSLMTEL